MTFQVTSFKGRLIGAAMALATAGALTAATAAEISGAGASFPNPIYQKWASAYQAATGNTLNYQSIGSGGGIKQIKARTVTFGASDKPLKPDEIEDMVQFPTVIGGVVPVVNLEGIAPGQLVFDGPTLAQIFNGEIRTWDDPAIKALNPDVALPSQAVVVVHRSDGSGTTFLFTNYLSEADETWKNGVGADSSIEWAVGVGAKGNEGVAGQVAQTAGAIGYVEFAYALENSLTYAEMINKNGKRVAPSIESFQAAAAGADWAAAPGMYLVLSDQPGDETWPIAGATFILMHKQSSDAAAAQEAIKFFEWAYANGDEAAVELHYVPMPDSVVELIKTQVWSQIN